jgi:hypothetical protein
MNINYSEHTIASGCADIVLSVWTPPDPGAPPPPPGGIRLLTMQLNFTALIPHRDIKPPLDALRQKFFSAGFYGAFSLPAFLPIINHEPREQGEPHELLDLKVIAANMRKEMGGKKFVPGDWKEFDLGGMRICGPEYEVPGFGHPVLSAIVLNRGCPQMSQLRCVADTISVNLRSSVGDLSFRAASLAEMCIEDADEGERGFSFKWEIGKPCWLPKKILTTDRTDEASRGR